MATDEILRFLAEQIATNRTATGQRAGGQKKLSSLIEERFEDYRDNRLNPSTIGRWEKELWKRGVLVEWVDYNALWRGEFSKSDSNGLRSDFRLRESLVIEISKDTMSNEAHLLYALANEAAHVIREKDLIKDYRHLVLGSGRALIRFAESLMNSPTTASNLAISPASGRLWVGDLSRLQDPLSKLSDLESPLDSDFAALFVARGLHHAQNPEIRLSQISHAAHVGSMEERDQVAESRCPFIPNGGWRWMLPSPDRIVVGAASLDDGTHPLNKLLKNSNPNVSEAVDPLAISYAAKSLARLQSETRGKGLPPPAEVTLQVFLCAPLPHELTESNSVPEPYKGLKRTVDEMNRRTLSLTWNHFQDVAAGGGISQIIAGGPAKQRLLWTLLLPNLLSGEIRPLFNSVCTDADTAKVLRRSSAMLEADPKLREKYSPIVDEIFELRDPTW